MSGTTQPQSDFMFQKMFSRKVARKMNNVAKSSDGGVDSVEEEGIGENETDSTEVDQDTTENKKEVQTEIPRVSISMDTSSAKSVETCLEVSVDLPTPGSRASSTTKLLPQDGEVLPAMTNSCQPRRKQLLRSQTMATSSSRRRSMTGTCHYGYPGITKPRENIVVSH